MGSGFFDVENSVWMFFNRMTDIFLLSVLWVVCSLSVVTAGASAAGFYYCAMKISEDSDYGVWRDFFAGFRNSFKTATILYLIQLLISLLLGFNMWISCQMNFNWGCFLFAVNGMLLFFVFCISLFAYPMTARYHFGIKKILSDAAVIACVNCPHTLGLALVLFLSVAAAWHFDYVYLFVPAVVGYQVARVSVCIFKKIEAKNRGR